MKNTLLKLLFIICLAFTLVNCSKSDNTNQPPDSDDSGQLTKIETVLNGNDQNLIELLHKVRGSVGKRGPGSKTLWSRKNDYGLGLYISANHVYGLNGWSSDDAEYFDTTAENLGIFETSQMPPPNGGITLGDMLISDFPLMHFAISPSATNTTILPEEDFYIGIIDNQRVEQSQFPQYPDLVNTNTPLEMFDPENRSKADETWNTPDTGENVLALGYPQDSDTYPNGAVAYGKVLSDSEAQEIITKLQEAGDPEGDIPYNSDAEFFIDAQGIAGMSGGGVFNSEGQLTGIMVRASDTENAPKIIRAVRISYIKAKMTAFYNSLSQTERNKIAPFINGEI
ncbi:serine protease [Zhouia spongiae]|uniref:Serine protease n=1 Tax=Zhouia spongiae TaxID=2202721 RepID=A0ABY3YQZ2_9FLAO|nr:serine protease [Zhouia spongiae]UNY99954.1 serine protease [Zhouia spongiae]